MIADYRFEDQPEPPPEEPLADAPPDAFARMVAFGRRVTGYDPGAEDEAVDELSAARTRRWIGRTVMVAALLLAVLNGASVKSWATTLPPGWAAETIHRLADVWNARMAAAGLDQPRQAIHDLYEGWKSQ